MDERSSAPEARPSNDSAPLDPRRPRVLPYTAVAGSTVNAHSRAARWRGRATLGLLAVFVAVAMATIFLVK